MSLTKDPSNTVTNGLAELTHWSSSLRWIDVPESVRRRCAMIFADDLSVIAAARDEPELIAMVEMFSRSSGPPEAAVFDGSGKRFDRYSAATVNGSAADWCELDSGYRRAVCHGGLYCIPALLAEGEATGASMEEMLRALLVGYETISRVARTFTDHDLVLHPHASLAATGAAATVAALRKHPGDITATAISTAATLVTPGPFNHAVEGALVRNIWPGVGGASGIRAVDWTEIGVTGRPESLYDVYSIAFGGAVQLNTLSEGLGNVWAVLDGYHKLHACCQYSHAAVEATLDVISGISKPVNSGDIRSIHLDTHRLGRKLDNPLPTTTLAAKFSMQHILATTAHHGHAGAQAFNAATLSNPAITKLRERVTIGAFEPEPEWPNDRPARVSWTLTDGTRIERECLSARGGPDRPFADEEIRAKIVDIVQEPYPKLPEIIDELLNLSAPLLARPWCDTVEIITTQAITAKR